MATAEGTGSAPAWHDEARQWLRTLFPTSRRFDIDVVRERTWGTAWTITTDDDRFWFKAAHPALRNEAALRRLLEHHAGRHVLRMIAAHPANGWIVTEDQGPTLAAQGKTTESRQIAELATTMGWIQQAVPLEELMALPLAVFRPEDAVANLDDALAWFARLPTDHPAHVDTAARSASLRAMEGQVRRWSSVDPGVDLTVDHNDLHPGNAFIGPIISDWGDAVISHPFCTMRTISFLTARVRADTHAVENAYLELWGDPADLREALHVAAQLAVCQRLRTWYLLDNRDLVAEYSAYITPLIHEIGQPPTQP